MHFSSYTFRLHLSRIVFDDLNGFDGFKPIEPDCDVFDSGLVIILYLA